MLLGTATSGKGGGCRRGVRKRGERYAGNSPKKGQDSLRVATQGDMVTTPLQKRTKRPQEFILNAPNVGNRTTPRSDVTECSPPGKVDAVGGWGVGGGEARLINAEVGSGGDVERGSLLGQCSPFHTGREIGVPASAAASNDRAAAAREGP